MSIPNIEYLKGIDLDRMDKQRVEKVRKGIKKCNLGALLTITGENTRYITPCRPGSGLMGQQYALLPCDGEPVLYENGMHEGPSLPRPARWWLGKRAKYAIPFARWVDSGVPETRLLQLRKWARQIKDCLKSMGVSNETIGIDIEEPTALRTLNEVGIKTDAAKGSELILECRETKTVDEVECLRMTGRIAEACFEIIKEMGKPGARENMIIAEMHRTATLLGASGANYTHLESGPNTWPMIATYTNRIIRPGDIIFSDVLIDFLGYKSCYYRTFSCGRPTKAQQDAYAKIRDLNWSTIIALKPEVTTKELVEKWPEAKDFGYPDEDCAYKMQWAHGIGLYNAERPTISRLWSLDYPYTLKENTTLAVEHIWPTGEKSIEYPNGQAVRIEEMVLITDCGYEMLSKWPKDEITQCGF